MDHSFDEFRDDHYIENYLLGHMRNTRSAFDNGQQFAKPIEDEDLFGIDNRIESVDNEETNKILCLHDSNLDYPGEEESLFRVAEYNNRNKKSQTPPPLFEDESLEPTEVADVTPEKQSSELDEIFPDDYSDSSQNVLEGVHRSASGVENTYMGKIITKHPPPLTAVQIKMKMMKDKLLQQARAMSVKPKRLGLGLRDDDVIEVTVEQSRLVSDTNSKFIFHKLFNKSNKSKTSPEKDLKSWDVYKQSLRSQICAQKRKIWDSLQRPMDEFDDEEEIVIPDDEEHSMGENKDQVFETAEDDNVSRKSDCESEVHFDHLENEDLSDTPEDVDENMDDISEQRDPASSADKSDVDSDDELSDLESEIGQAGSEGFCQDQIESSILDDDSSNSISADRHRPFFVDDEASEE